MTMKNELQSILKALNRHTAQDTGPGQFCHILKGVFLDAEMQQCVATDGVFLAVVPAKIRGKSRIVAARNIKAPRTIKKDKENPAVKKGERIKGEYPNYSCIIPFEEKCFEVDLEKTIPALQSAIQVHKSEMKSKDFMGSKDMYPIVSVPLFDSNGTLSKQVALMNASRVLQSIKTLQEVGNDKIFYQDGDKWASCLLKGNKGFAVIAPIGMDSDKHPMGIFLK